MTREGGSGWKIGLALGCVAAIGLAAGLTFLVAKNWSSISEVYRGAAELYGEVRTVQKALQEKYAGSRIRVNVRRSTSEPGTTLSVEFENSDLLADLDPKGPEAKQKAMEIAVAARDALPDRSGYESYEVVFSRKASVGLTIKETQRFVFGADELPPAGPVGER